MFAWGWQTWDPAQRIELSRKYSVASCVVEMVGAALLENREMRAPKGFAFEITFEFHMWATRLSFPSAGGACPILCGFSPRVGIPDCEPPGILTWFLPQSNGITVLQFKVRLCLQRR